MDKRLSERQLFPEFHNHFGTHACANNSQAVYVKQNSVEVVYVKSIAGQFAFTGMMSLSHKLCPVAIDFNKLDALGVCGR